MEPSSDFKTWTLELRDGVKFSDGTPVDSAAVSASLNRYVTNKGPQSSLYASKVASVDTPDPSTVVFNLVDPWTGIESLLSTGPGMIVAPSAQQGDQFTPIGAGAFTLEKFAPNEELILDARERLLRRCPERGQAAVDQHRRFTVHHRIPQERRHRRRVHAFASERPGSDRLRLPGLRRHSVAVVPLARQHGSRSSRCRRAHPSGIGARNRSRRTRQPTQRGQGSARAGHLPGHLSLAQRRRSDRRRHRQGEAASRRGQG